MTQTQQPGDEAKRHEPSAQEQDAQQSFRDQLISQFGGWRGFVDSALPSFAFIIANLIGGLETAIWAGAVVGVLVFIVRLVRKESVQQAFSGLFALAICILIARATGEARGFFAFGIVRSGLLTLVLLVSIAIRRPLIGILWNFVSPSEKPWREDSRQVRMFQWLTAAWAGGFLIKFLVEGGLYLADSPTGLGAVRIILGYPLTLGLLLVTYLVVTKMRGDVRPAGQLGRFGNRRPSAKNQSAKNE